MSFLLFEGTLMATSMSFQLSFQNKCIKRLVVAVEKNLEVAAATQYFCTTSNVIYSKCPGGKKPDQTLSELSVPYF